MSNESEPKGPLPPPRVLIICDYFPPSARAGGPSRSLFGIVCMERTEATITILTRDHDIGTSTSYKTDEIDEVQALIPNVTIERLPRRRERIRVWRALGRKIHDADIVYLNSLFSPTYSVLPMLILRFRIVPRRPILLAPRGELSAGALSIKSTKKRLALPVLRSVLGGLEVVWHASSPHEADDIRRFFGPKKAGVLVRANPSPRPAAPPLIAPCNDTLTVAFVARMAPIKNFMLIARAIELVDIPLQMIVAGSLEDSAYWAACRQVLERAGPNVRVEVRGHIDDPEVLNLLNHADAMILPTRGENFGRSIAEALSVGCPVVIPDTTLWTPLIHRGAGWLIDVDDPIPLVRVVRTLASMRPTERSRIRAHAIAEYGRWWNQSQKSDSLFQKALDEVSGWSARNSLRIATRVGNSPENSLQQHATDQGQPNNEDRYR
jgi:glycosyltransferase involved in cell wall biosynthesis